MAPYVRSYEQRDENIASMAEEDEDSMSVATDIVEDTLVRRLFC